MVGSHLRNAGEHTGRKDYRGLLASDHAKNHSAMITLLEARFGLLDCGTFWIFNIAMKNIAKLTNW